MWRKAELKQVHPQESGAHDAVYARLGPSAIHGVGVFAITAIPEGVNVFGNDAGPIVWFSIAAIVQAGLGPELMRLYHDFGIVRGDLIGAPVNFNSLTPGWYVNEPIAGQAANLSMTDDFHFFAVRDIEPGEELTASYASYSDAVDTITQRLF